MNGLKILRYVRRSILVLGILLALAVGVHTYVVDTPFWFDKTMYLVSFYTVFTLLLGFGFSEVLSQGCSTRLGELFLICVVLIWTAVPAVRLAWGALFGREIAEVNTWHLLLLFTVGKQIVFTALACIVLSFLYGLVRLATMIGKNYRGSRAKGGGAMR